MEEIIASVVSASSLLSSFLFHHISFKEELIYFNCVVELKDDVLAKMIFAVFRDYRGLDVCIKPSRRYYA